MSTVEDYIKRHKLEPACKSASRYILDDVITVMKDKETGHCLCILEDGLAAVNLRDNNGWVVYG